MCDHNFIHGGVRFKKGETQLAGSSAYPILYYDWFYCSKCLADRYRRLDIGQHNSYQPILYNATPMPNNVADADMWFV